MIERSERPTLSPHPRNEASQGSSSDDARRELPQPTPALPRVSPSDTPQDHGLPQAPAQAPFRRRVLVVDDNQDAADSLSMLLELMGHEVAKAYEGRAAVELAGSFRPQLALLDIGMPEVDGYDVARRIRSQPGGREAILVALTGWGQREHRRRAEEEGFDHHIVKPVDLTVLRRLLDTP